MASTIVPPDGSRAREAVARIDLCASSVRSVIGRRRELMVQPAIGTPPTPSTPRRF
ncbi:MAG: hypothetical protein ACYCSI_04615 [Solirubrobacteraceae bacterium]